jgi:hypothetical protein
MGILILLEASKDLSFHLQKVYTTNLPMVQRNQFKFNLKHKRQSFNPRKEE